jgi:hypothetical protein
VTDGVSNAELTTYLELLGKLTPAQWGAARQSGRRVSESAKNNAARAEGMAVAKAKARAANRDLTRLAAANSARKMATGVACDAAQKAATNAGLAAEAIVVRDLITVEQFAAITVPMRAAGIDFDQLTAVKVSQ